MTSPTRARPAAVHQCVDCRALPEWPRDPALVDGRVDYRPRVARPVDFRSQDGAYGGPRSWRCTTHYRAHVVARKATSRATQRAHRRGLGPDLQRALWTFQGSQCPCGAKASAEIPAGVSLDHDHDYARAHCDHDPDAGCVRCVLGFLCRACNRDVVGRFTSRRGGRAEVATTLRALADFLDEPPLSRLLDERPYLLWRQKG